MSNYSFQAAMILALIISITTHEASHGFMAKSYGDSTAEAMGRLTLNPIAHVDLFGTILLPAFLFLVHAPFLFGYAKPVPVNFRNLSPRRMGEFMVALAGPGVNFILAFISALIMHLTTPGKTFTNELLLMLVQINIVLGVFNLFPLLPLDGGRMLNALLPPRLSISFSRLEPFGFFILIALLLLPVYHGQSIMYLILPPIIRFVTTIILVLSGHL